MILFPDVERIGPNAGLFRISGGTPPYRWYLAGRLVFEDSQTERIYEDPDNVMLAPFEIHDADETSTPLSIKFPPTKILQWRGVAGADRYIVSRITDDSGFEDFMEIAESGLGYYQVGVRVADEDEEYNGWIVRTQDKFGSDGQAVAIVAQMIQVPRPPQIQYTWDEGNLMVTAYEQP